MEALHICPPYGMPGLVDEYKKQQLAERWFERGSGDSGNEDNAKSDEVIEAVDSAANDENLADDDVYNQRREVLEGKLQEMEAADGELPQLAQLTGGGALMNILRKQAQQEMGIKGDDVMDDRQRKIGEKFSDGDEAKIAAWAERKMAEVERYREIKDQLEELE